MVDGYRSKLINVVSGMLQGGILGPLLIRLYTSGFFSILENKLIGYADDSTFIAAVPSPGVGVTVAESWSVTLAGLVLVSGVTFGEWNWMRVRPRL